MALPESFARDGFINPKDIRPRLLVGSEGETNTGKTEFMLSCPPPGIIITCERGHEAALQNAEPPKSRNEDFIVFPVKIPKALQHGEVAEAYQPYWTILRDTLYKGLHNEDALSIGFDGDSDSWELQRLAAFGKLTQIPGIMYTQVNAARRSLITHCYDSGKNVIMSNKVKDEYVTEYDAAGNPVTNKDGSERRVKSGNLERQGFGDYNYLYQVHIRHHYVKPEPINLEALPVKDRLAAIRSGMTMTEGVWGIEILKCKVKTEIEGQVLWGDKCNFMGLVELIYHHRKPTYYCPCLCLKCSDWGFR